MRGKGLPHTSHKVTHSRVDIMWLLLVSGYQRVGVVPYSFLCHFVLIVTLNDLKTFLNGFINMVCYFIVLCTSLWKRYDLSVEKGIFLWISMNSNVL